MPSTVNFIHMALLRLAQSAADGFMRPNESIARQKITPESYWQIWNGFWNLPGKILLPTKDTDNLTEDRETILLPSPCLLLFCNLYLFANPTFLQKCRICFFLLCGHFYHCFPMYFPECIASYRFTGKFLGFDCNCL